jgi:hypothetical protein
MLAQSRHAIEHQRWGQYDRCQFYLSHPTGSKHKNFPVRMVHGPVRKQNQFFGWAMEPDELMLEKMRMRVYHQFHSDIDAPKERFLFNLRPDINLIEIKRELNDFIKRSGIEKPSSVKDYKALKAEDSLARRTLAKSLNLAKPPKPTSSAIDELFGMFDEVLRDTSEDSVAIVRRVRQG